jgi:hypothetical protein
MSERQSGGSTWLYFIVGALVVMVAVLAYIMLEGAPSDGDVNLQVEVPAQTAPQDGGDAAGGETDTGQ